MKNLPFIADTGDYFSKFFRLSCYFRRLRYSLGEQPKMRLM